MKLILFKNSENSESVAPPRSMDFLKFLGKINHALRVRLTRPTASLACSSLEPLTISQAASYSNGLARSKTLKYMPTGPKEMADTEGRIEKAFHAQTRFLVERTNELKTEIASQTRWLVTLILTMNITTIAAVLFKS